MKMTWRNLLSVTLNENGGFDVHVGWVLLVAVVVVAGFYVVVRYWLLRGHRRFDIVEAEVSLGKIGSVRIRPSYEEVQIAHRAWVELSTRKAGLPFDDENDVVFEVYDSWYELFGRTRELVKEIPAHRLRSSKDTRGLGFEAADPQLGTIPLREQPEIACCMVRYRDYALTAK